MTSTRSILDQRRENRDDPLSAAFSHVGLAKSQSRILLLGNILLIPAKLVQVTFIPLKERRRIGLIRPWQAIDTYRRNSVSVKLE